MHIYLGIDDTDALDTPGSGHVAEELAKTLQQRGLASRCTAISRHQLFVHQDIPYTSHNSSMCFTAEVHQDQLADVVQTTGRFLQETSAPGSDPGFCLAAGDNPAGRQLIAFGLKAKQEVCSKQEAYALADKTGIHLSEHGGTGQGVVGALAAIGLRLHGSDGRFRGWLKLGKAGEIATGEFLGEDPRVDAVVDEQGRTIPKNSLILLAEDTIKTVWLNHRQVIPVTRTGKPAGPAWTTLSRSAVKKF